MRARLEQASEIGPQLFSFLALQQCRLRFSPVSMHDEMRQERFSAMHFLLVVFRFCALQKARPVHKL
jgi:hypothetical protein